ncbi:MAG: DUF6084 family protein [Actinomycetota bacterium]|jgi:hypothetical protein|nr:DUF6084 family protein [Actinomycetota bacterium]MDQ3450871.1 DUF6084 family protein [Actinomycetota bacterium]
MTQLAISVLDVAPERYAVAPNLMVKLRIEESTGQPIHAIALRCQVRIEPQRRAYAGPERAGLVELFGLPEQWSKTLTPFLWTHASTTVRGFSGSIDVDLPVTCTYDFEVAAAKYLHTLRDGEIPLVFLFTGTVFTRGITGFGVEQISWDLEATHRMPVKVWHDLMDLYFPGSGWIRVDRDTLDALMQFKAARGLTSWEEAFSALLPRPEERAS